MVDSFHNARFRHGSARFASMEDIHRGGAFKATGADIFAGFAGGQPLLYNGAAGGFIVAGPRQNKFTSFLMMNWARGASHLNRIVLDIKAEGYLTTDVMAPEDRHLIGWAPWEIPGVVSSKINAVEHMTIENPHVEDESINLGEVACPTSGDKRAEYFERRSQTIVSSKALALTETFGVLDLGRLYEASQMLIAGGDVWKSHFAPIMKNSRFQSVRDGHDEITELINGDGGGFDGIRGELSKNFAGLASNRLRDSVSPPFDFSLSDLCNSDQKYALHLCPKPEFLGQSSLVIKLMFLCAKSFRANRPDAPRQAWWVDEASQLKGAKFMLDAYTIGAGSWGITPFTVWQDSRQMNELAPGAERILPASAGLQIYAGLRDFSTAKRLSERIGCESLSYDDEVAQARADLEYNEAIRDLMNGEDMLHAGLRAQHFADSRHIQSKMRRLLRSPDEILNTPLDRSYVFMDKVPGAIYATRKPMYQIPWMAGRYLGNPYGPIPADRVEIMTPNGPDIRRVITERVPERYAHFPQHSHGYWSYVEGYRP
ncbi:MAG: type IV secretory system conjugative DNA transfer family protein [Henriciella sp.]|nr:type IV secretory system conjugative DNA transfer family protein [Henriciella sp.]